jgi:hypothetical protein
VRRGSGRAQKGRDGIARIAAILCLAASILFGSRAEAQAPLAIRADSLQVVFWEGQEGLARRTLAAAVAPLPLPGIPGDHRLIRGKIYLAPSQEIMDSLTGGRVPHWAAGVAIPSLQRIVLPAFGRSRSPLEDPVVVLRHELAHLALNAYLPRPIPRWFDEGYATWVSGGLDESAGWQIRFAFLLGRGPPLDSLTLAWPRQEGRARLAYLLSASAVRHMATRSSDRAFEALLVSWRELGTLDAAIRTTYQMTLGQFEKEWAAVVKRRYGWLLAISQIGAFWFVITLLLLVLGSIRKRRDREKLARMEAEEKLLPPWEEPELVFADEYGRPVPPPPHTPSSHSPEQSARGEGGGGVDSAADAPDDEQRGLDRHWGRE